MVPGMAEAELRATGSRSLGAELTPLPHEQAAIAGVPLLVMGKMHRRCLFPV